MTVAGITGSSFVAEVGQFVGKVPYVYGGDTPQGFDCSGLIEYALTKLGGQNVPRTSEAQWSWVTKISQAQLQPGDLVFSQWPGDGPSPGHVAIYAGNGQIIEAPHPGEMVHQIPLDSGYLRYVTGFGRVPGIQGGGVSGVSYITPGSGTRATNVDFGGLLPDWLSAIVGGDPLSAVLGTVLGPLANVFTNINSALGTGMHMVLWLVNPMNWVRIIAGIAGTAAVIAGAVLIAKAA